MLGRIKGLFKSTVPFLINHPLWADNKLVPLSRFFRLQLSFLLGKKKLFLKWFGSISFIIEKGDNGLTGNYYVGLHEFNEMGFTIHLLREDDVFVDVGANLGSYSLLASGICGCKTVAFEPIELTFEKLTRNILINKISDKVELRKKAILSAYDSEKYNKLVFSSDQGCCNKLVDENYTGEKQHVEVSTLDKECQFLSPSLIKIDVESFEESVLLGGLKTLGGENLMALIVEGNSPKTDSLLRSKGFQDYKYYPLDREIRNQTETEKKFLKRNWIWIKENKIEFINKRLKNAQKRKIYKAEL